MTAKDALVAEKACTACRVVKPLAQFHASRKPRDGRRSKCSDCHCSEQRAWKESHLEEARARQRDAYWRDPEKYRAASRTNRANGKGQSREYFKRYVAEHKEGRRNSVERWNAANREKRAAHGVLWRAIRSGLVARSASCEACGSCGVRIEAHHEDYSVPLSVIWLCKRCHYRADRKRGVAA